MIELVPFNDTDPEHVKLYLEVCQESGASLYDDPNRNYLLNLNRMDTSTYWVVLYGKELGGFVGAILDTNKVAYLEGGSLKRFQTFFPARKALSHGCNALFKKGVRKIKVFIPAWNHEAEAVVRSIGFRKEGLQRQELYYDGKPTDLVEMGLFPHELNARHKKHTILKLMRKKANG